MIEMKKLFATAQISGGPAAVREIQGDARASVEHVPCIAPGSGAREFHARNPEALLAQALDRAHDSMSLPGIHRGSTDDGDAYCSRRFRGRKSKIAGAQPVAMLISDGSQNA